MRYFVTGASGFIGKRLVRRLLDREGAIVYFLLRPQKSALAETLRAGWGVSAERAIAASGDITQPNFGLAESDLASLRGRVDHLFHLAAVYDLRASAQAQESANIQGTANAVAFAHAIEAGCFHLVSSIAAAGLYEGTFREDMFEEAQNLAHPYFRTKHESEAIVRRDCRRPWRVYRPGIVVGDSRTGEMDKIDGPYYFFKTIQTLRRLLPAWMPAIGLEGGRLNLVPVDFVVAAMDHIAHQPGLDERCFHLTDPSPNRVGDILNLFAHAGHAPELTFRINPRSFALIPESVRRGLLASPAIARFQHQLMDDLGLPRDVMQFVNYPTRFDCRAAQRALEGSGIRVPPLEDYAWKLWDYWERHLDPDLHVDRSLRALVQDQVVLITGAAAGIGKATARKLAAAGAKVLIIDRDEQALAQTNAELTKEGAHVSIHTCDLTEYEQTDRLVADILREHGAVDILINNAGRSIRRAIEQSYDRFHDFERLMQLNYFGALRLTLGLLPSMQQRKHGHVINISSIGVLTNAPRFSAYVASKAAFDAFTRCAASEFADNGVHFTTINMPLVRTAMTAPTKAYERTPMLSPDEAADFVIKAIIAKPERVATRLGVLGELVHALAPKLAHLIMNSAFRMFPDSGTGAEQQKLTSDQAALAELLRGIHL